jgi:hypothetical protein
LSSLLWVYFILEGEKAMLLKCRIKPPKTLDNILTPIKKLCKKIQIEPNHFLVCVRNEKPAIEITGITESGSRSFVTAFMERIENEIEIIIETN